MNTKKSQNNRKNLSLSRETLRTLQNDEIVNVVGGLQQEAAFSRNGTCWSCNSCIACA
jgi:hypothetical protein